MPEPQETVDRLVEAFNRQDLEGALAFYEPDAVDEMRTKVQKWGNSLGLRIPKALAEAAEVREGASVELTLQEGEIVVRPTARRYELAELVSGVRGSNLHAEEVTGAPQGREAW